MLLELPHVLFAVLFSQLPSSFQISERPNRIAACTCRCGRVDPEVILTPFVLSFNPPIPLANGFPRLGLGGQEQELATW